MSPELTKEYKSQLEIVKWIKEHFSDLPLHTSTENEYFAQLALDLSIEHHRAILTLFEHGLYGSMLALFRVLLESHIRGAFFLLLAAPTDISYFKRKDELKPTFRSLIERVQDEIKDDDLYTRLRHTETINELNSFTHSGISILTERISNGIISSDNYSADKKKTTLKLSGALALISANYLSAFSTDKDLSQKILNFAETVIPENN